MLSGSTHVHDIHYKKDYNPKRIIAVNPSHIHDIHYNKDFNTARSQELFLLPFLSKINMMGIP